MRNLRFRLSIRKRKAASFKKSPLCSAFLKRCVFGDRFYRMLCSNTHGIVPILSRHLIGTEVVLITTPSCQYHSGMD